MELWGKELTREDAINRIAELELQIYRMEHSKRYAELSDAGDDSMWYEIEADLEEIDMLREEYNIEEE